MPSAESRIVGGLWGLLVGDAVGVPYEFHSPASIPPRDQIDLDPPAGFDRAHKGVPPGTWSDDGAHALCLLESLLERGRLDPEDLMTRLVGWYDRGDLAVDGLVFDVGVQTSAAIVQFKSGVPALDCGSTMESGNGNGSLMRSLPMALWHRGTDRELLVDAMEQSRITHAHLRSQICCGLYCLWARQVLEEREDPWGRAIEIFRELMPEGSSEREEFEASVRPEAIVTCTGSGYVVDCLRSARQANEQGSFEATIKSAIGLGRDTDTTACVAGGIAGVRWGLEGIPIAWRERLRGQELFAPLLRKLVKWRQEDWG